MVFGAYWTGKPEVEEPEPRQPCGHPGSAIRCDDEGTHYCWLCEHAGQQEEENERADSV